VPEPAVAKSERSTGAPTVPAVIGTLAEVCPAGIVRTAGKLTAEEANGKA
jgi:hypothetical protein